MTLIISVVYISVSAAGVYLFDFPMFLRIFFFHPLDANMSELLHTRLHPRVPPSPSELRSQVQV